MGDTAVTALVAAFPGEDGQAEVHVEVRCREPFALILVWFACGMRIWNAQIQRTGGIKGVLDLRVLSFQSRLQACAPSAPLP